MQWTPVQQKETLSRTIGRTLQPVLYDDMSRDVGAAKIRCEQVSCSYRNFGVYKGHAIFQLKRTGVVVHMANRGDESVLREDQSRAFFCLWTTEQKLTGCQRHAISL